MHEPPTVAVIIPTYDRAHFLVQALESVLAQSRAPDEVIVVDDGSTTGATANALAKYKDRIRYLRKSNGGLPSALNCGLAATDADYIAVLDDDDLAAPDALERHVRFLQSRSDVDFSYSGCYRFWSDTTPTPPYAGHLELYDCVDVAPEDLFLCALETYPFHTQSMLVPLACYRAIRGFDESRHRSEDYDMILRLAREFRGAKLGEPAFLLREHSGDRGPAGERHGIHQRDKVFVEEGRRLFADLREKLPLADYVKRTDASEPLNDTETRHALLQRACAMARHGLFDEALEDIESATRPPLLKVPVTLDEQQICTRMMNLDPMLLEGNVTFPRRTATALRAAPTLLYACMKGLSWSISREYRKGHYRTAAAMTGTWLRAVGGGNGVAFAREYFGHAREHRTTT